MVFQGTPSKDVDSTKESSRPERPSVFAKRSSQAGTLHHKKPASSVDAEIVGGSTVSSQATLKQEVSTASSKGTTLKTGIMLWSKTLASTCNSASLLPTVLSCSIMHAWWHFEDFNDMIPNLQVIE